jgi:hypothetical protein
MKFGSLEILEYTKTLSFAKDFVVLCVFVSLWLFTLTSRIELPGVQVSVQRTPSETQQTMNSNPKADQQAILDDIK